MVKNILIKNITTENDYSCNCSVYIVDCVEVVKSGTLYRAPGTEWGTEAIKKLVYCLANPDKELKGRFVPESKMKMFEASDV